MKIELPLDGNARSLVRPTSKVLFGSEFALEVMLVMEGRDRFFGAELAELAGCENSFASGLLRRYASVGLIEPMPRDPGQVRKYFCKRASPIWEAARDLAVSLLAVEEPGVARISPRAG